MGRKSLRSIALLLVLFGTCGHARGQEQLERATQEAAPVLEEAEVHLGTAEDAERGVHATRIRREETERKANAEVAEIQLDISSGTVLLMTMLMAGAAGLGTIPFFFTGKLSKEIAALANAVACGVMIACSFDLIHEGQPYGANLVIAGVVLGAIFISASQQWLEQFEDVRFQGLQGINARKILLMIGIMAAHAFGEGAGVGVSFCGSRGWAQGVLVTLAIGLHNIPEGLAVSTVLVGRGISPRSALLWTLFTAMPQPLVAVPSFLFVDAFKVLLPLALGFAAGCMVWMVFAELLPDALADAPHGKVATVGTFSAASLEGLRMLLSGLEGGGGKIAMPVALNANNLAAAGLFLLPAAVSGAVVGSCAKYLPKEKASQLGLAAGVLTWQGLAALSDAAKNSKDVRLMPSLACVVAGAVSTVLLRTVIQLQSKGGTQKEKTGDTPTKSKAGIVIAADQHPGNGHTSAGSLDDLEAGRGTRGRVFEPYKHQENVSGELAAAIAAVILMSVYEGQHTATSRVSGELQVTRLWLALGVRALVPSVVGVTLFWRRCSSKLLIPLTVGFACVAPAATSFLRVRAELSGGSGNFVGGYLPGLAAGAALTAGLWLLWPLGRRGGARQATWGLLQGLSIGIMITTALKVLCWQMSSCL